MLVTFVRTVGEKDRIYVRRDDGSEASWSFASYGDQLPHDLIHLVLEAEFAIVPGLWGRVARGADLGRINADASRTGGRDKYQALGTDLDDLLWSEAVAGDRWSGTSDEILAAIARNAASLAAPPQLTHTDVERCRQRLAGLRERWRCLTPKGALRFEHPGAVIVY